MQGKATINGHPIHPMLIPFPIAFFVGALISDIISRWGDPIFWPRMSVVLIGLGLLGAAAAGLFGYIDYATAPMSPQAKRTATTHMILNVITIVVFAIALYLRWNEPTSVAGYVFTVLGVIVLGASGYLGGHLSYHYGVGVSDDAVRQR